MNLSKVFLVFFMFIGLLDISGQTTKELFSKKDLRMSYIAVNDVGFVSNSTYFFNKDTIICGLDLLEYETVDRQIFYLNISSGQVELRYDPCMEGRIILDFDMEVGDTIGIQNFRFEVTSTSTTTFDDMIPRRKLTLNGGTPGFDIDWVEGLGDLRFGFLGPSVHVGYEFICAYDKDGLVTLTTNPDLQELCDSFACRELKVDLSYEQEGSDVQLLNLSQNASSYEWTLPNDLSSIEKSPSFNLPEPGCYFIGLKAKNICGAELSEHLTISYCIDSLWVNKNSDHPFTSLSFLNEEVGFSIGSNKLYKTRDGGATWQELSFPTAGPNVTRFPVEVSMVNEDVVMLACGHFGASADQKAILMSYDGGNTWLEKVEDSYYINGGIITPDGQGFAGRQYQQYIFYSDDLGLNWKTKPTPFRVDLLRFQYLGDNKIVASGYKGVLPEADFVVAISDNSGDSWNIVQFSDYHYQDLRSFHFVDENLGFVGGKGFILKTTDGGQSWKEISLNLPHLVYDLEFLNEQEGWLTGATENGLKSIIMYTANGGKTWQAQYCNNSERFGQIALTGSKAYVTLPTKGFFEFAPDEDFMCLTHSEELDIAQKPWIHPNPTNNSITLNAPLKKSHRISIYNLMGHRVFIQENVLDQAQLDLSPLLSGTYIVRLSSETEVDNVVKLVITN